MSEWQYVRIGDLGRVVTGSTPPAKHPEWFGGGTPFLTPSDISAGERRAQPQRRLSPEGRIGLRSRLVPRGSVCFVSIGATIGKTCLTEVESITNQQINTVVPGTKTDAHFIYYLLRNEASRIASTAGGAATPLLNKTAFAAVVVSVPDLSTQNKIGAILCALDDLIENNRQRMRVLEKMAQALYREWFVHFRYSDGTRITFVESILGPVPHGWNVCRLDEACMFVDGKVIKKEERSGAAVPVFGANGKIGSTDLPPPFENCTVMGKIGSCGALHRSTSPCWVTNNAFAVLPGLWRSRFLVWLGIQEIDFTPLIGGSANPYLPRTSFGHLPVLHAPDPLTDRFQALVEPIYREIDSLDEVARKVKSTRELILPRLVTGQNDVSSLDLGQLLEESVA